MKTAASILIIAAALYGAFLAVVWLFSDSLMFHPSKRTYVKTPEHFFFDCGGHELAGIFLKAEKPVCKIFHCHGNGEDLGMVYPLLDALRKSGFDVFCYDYPGYGFSAEKPTEKNLYLSAETAWKCARERFGFAPENTVLSGFSLGSAAALHVSTLEKGWRGAVVMGGIAQGGMVVLPINIVPWKILDNESKIRQFNSPLLLLHGSDDNIVPFRNAKANFAAANEPKKLFRLEGCRHNDIFASPEFWAELLAFLKNPQK